MPLRRARIDAILRGLDDERLQQGLTKTELAQLAGKRGAFVRRVLGGGEQNPTLDTVLALAHELGLTVALQRR